MMVRLKLRPPADPAKDSTKNSSMFPLTSLPYDLQLQISKHAVRPADGVVVFDLETARKPLTKRTRSGSAFNKDELDAHLPALYRNTSIGIMHTCRTYRDDLTKHFYETNVFKFTSDAALERSLAAIGPSKANLIKFICLEAPLLPKAPVETLCAMGGLKVVMIVLTNGIWLPCHPLFRHLIELRRRSKSGVRVDFSIIRPSRSLQEPHWEKYTQCWEEVVNRMPADEEV